MSSSIAALLLSLLLPPAPVPQRDWPIGVAGVDVEFVRMPDCAGLLTGARVEDANGLARLLGERCRGASPPEIDLTRRSLVGITIWLDCNGNASVAVRRDDTARIIQVHTTVLDGGCRAMGRGGDYWFSMPKVPPGYPIVFTSSRVDRGERMSFGKPEEAETAPDATLAMARTAAASVVVLETFDSTALDAQPSGRASGFAVRDGRVVTSARAMKWAVAARVRVPSAAGSLPVAAVVGLDLVRDLCVLDVPGLDVQPVATAEAPEMWSDLFVPSIVESPGLDESASILFDRFYIGDRDDRGLVDLGSHVAAGTLGAPVLDAAGRVLGIATMGRGRNGYTGFLTPAALFDAPPVTSRMPVNAAGWLTRTDAEAAGFIYGRVRRVVETVRRAGDGVPIRVSERSYDGRGMVTSHTTRDLGEVLETEYEYDARGLVTRVVERDSRSRARLRSFRKTEAQAIADAALYAGPSRLESRLDSGGREVYELDRAGAVLRTAELDAAGRLVGESVNTYEHGVLARVLETRVKQDGSREVVRDVSYEYAYDQLSHWTRRTARERQPGAKEPGQVVEVAERTIEYYDK